jgi:threonine aldolase
MRQAGILASAASYALDFHVDRLVEDHKRAKAIAEVLSNANYVKELLPVDTNIIIFKLIDQVNADVFLAKLKSEGIVANTMGKQTVRFVTHLDFDDDKLERTINVLRHTNSN